MLGTCIYRVIGDQENACGGVDIGWMRVLNSAVLLVCVNHLSSLPSIIVPSSNAAMYLGKPPYLIQISSSLLAVLGLQERDALLIQLSHPEGRGGVTNPTRHLIPHSKQFQA